MTRLVSRIPVELLGHPVARVSGVTADDDPITAIEKIILMMRSAGFSPRYIREAERELAEYRARIN